jgi:uncharacterized protein YdeI (YjbR/CyaY-like superfamily)
MQNELDNLPILSFFTAEELHSWLLQNHATSQGIWVRVGKANSGLTTVSFDELLDEGLCFGWSESTRRKGDEQSYLQRFTPRRKKGTRSKRNEERIEKLIQEGRMMPSGLKVLSL